MTGTGDGRSPRDGGGSGGPTHGRGRGADRAERRARFQEQVRDHVESPGVRRRWASRGRRRALAVVLLAVILAGAVGLFLLDADGSPSWPGLVGYLALMVLGAVLATQLNAATRNVKGLLPLLDERQRAEQLAAARRAHEATTFVLAGLLLGAMVMYVSRAQVPVTAVAAGLWGLMMLHTALPGIILAWTQPDEVLDDAEG